MKSILAASSAFALAGALLVGPAFAQTASPSWNQPVAQPYAGQAAQPYAAPAVSQPYTGEAAPQQETARGTLPQGSYLSTCKDARMLDDTLTAFCSKGDGTWQTTQLWHAYRCTAGVQNAGGDLVCGMEPQMGSSTPPESYGSSYGSAYGTVAPRTARVYSPAYVPAPSPAYPAPTYNGYGTATSSWPNAYGTGPYGTYGAAVPSANQYSSPSATRTAQPYGY